MHRKVAAALLAVLALGAAGCGSSERTLSRAELIRRVEIACREARQTTAKHPVRSGATGTEATVQFVNALLDGQLVLVARINNVTGSGDVKADFVEFKQAAQQRLALFQRVVRASPAEARRAITAAASQIEALTTRMRDSATRLGIEGCA